MNIALCLYGHVGISDDASSRTEGIELESQAASTNPVVAASSFHRNLFSKYNTATFIHTWSKEHEKLLKELYNPQLSIFEDQVDFTEPLSLYGIEGENIENWKISADARKGYELLLPSRGSVTEIKKEMKREIFRTRSRWYSTKKVVELKSQFEQTHSRKFDYVIISRLDCEFANAFVFEDKSPDKFYASLRHGRPDKDFALFDFYFMGGSEIIDKFATLYDVSKDYCIRPTIACREHVKKTIGDEKLVDYLTYSQHYRKVR